MITNEIDKRVNFVDQSRETVYTQALSDNLGEYS